MSETQDTDLRNRLRPNRAHDPAASSRAFRLIETRALAARLDSPEHEQPGALDMEIFQTVSKAFRYYRWRLASGAAAGPLAALLRPYLSSGRSLTVRDCARIYLKLTEDENRQGEDASRADAREARSEVSQSALGASRRELETLARFAFGEGPGTTATRAKWAAVMLRHYRDRGVRVQDRVLSLDDVLGKSAARQIRQRIGARPFERRSDVVMTRRG